MKLRREEKGGEGLFRIERRGKEPEKATLLSPLFPLSLLSPPKIWRSLRKECLFLLSSSPPPPQPTHFVLRSERGGGGAREFFKSPPSLLPRRKCKEAPSAVKCKNDFSWQEGEPKKKVRDQADAPRGEGRKVINNGDSKGNSVQQILFP